MPSDDSWTACPEGILDDLLAVEKASRRRERIRRWSALTAVAGLVLVAVYQGGFGSYLGSADDGLTCAQVRELAADYRADRVSRQVRAKIDSHLAECPHCAAVLADRVARLPYAGPDNRRPRSTSSARLQTLPTDERILDYRDAIAISHFRDSGGPAWAAVATIRAAF